ncbi:MAG: hypothetical protein AAB784_02655 [Patescibacteria group bacterium]
MGFEKTEMTAVEIRKKIGHRFDRFAFKDVAFMMMSEVADQFSQDIREIIKKVQEGGEISLTGTERRLFNNARNVFWEERFGMNFKNRVAEDAGLSVDDKAGDGLDEFKTKQKDITPSQSERFKLQKVAKMEALRQAFKNLDEGEAVEEFRDETRRIIYFNEDSGQYFIEEGGQIRYLNVMDVLSDYAWGIKYVPDGEMIEPAYRRIAKRILTNETRRDVEVIHDKELVLDLKRAGLNLQQDVAKLETTWLSRDRESGTTAVIMGFFAEIMARELIARMSSKMNLGFVVERASVVDDCEYKIDFKIRSAAQIRGVGIGDEQDIRQRTKKIGIQFTISVSPRVLSRKRFQIFKAKKQFMAELPVSDIVLVTLPRLGFEDAIDRWFKDGKPSGGPERYLSVDLQKELLDNITDEFSV